GQFHQSQIRPAFYQAWFAPAVLFACGDGFRNADWSRDETLSAFLLQRRDRLACRDVARGLPEGPFDLYQTISLYLEWALALTWRIAGVSWGATSWLAGCLAALFAATVYGVMRLGMRPLVAASGAVVVVTSPLHLRYVPELRDYSKAPFLLILLLLMGIVVTRPVSRRAWLGRPRLAGRAGAVARGV